MIRGPRILQHHRVQPRLHGPRRTLGTAERDGYKGLEPQRRRARRDLPSFPGESDECIRRLFLLDDGHLRQVGPTILQSEAESHRRDRCRLQAPRETPSHE